MPTLTRLLFIAFALALSTVSAAPSPKVTREATFPEFIPPPGFPSLAELNVTTEMLRTTKPKTADFQVMQDPTCGNGRLVTANVDDVITCFNFLMALGTYVITVTQNDCTIGLCGMRQVAQYGNAWVHVQTMTGNPASSYSSDVALGVQWVFTNCNSGGQVAGTAAANGNGDIRVWATGLSH